MKVRRDPVDWNRRPSQYDWDLLMDGQVWELDIATEVPHVKNFRRYASKRAILHRKKFRTMIRDGKLIVQAIDLEMKDWK